MGDDCSLSSVGCFLCHFKNTVRSVFCYLSVSHFFVPHFGVSAWRSKCTIHMGPNSDVVQ